MSEKIKCDICGEFYENDDENLRIQRNEFSGKMVCIDCAIAAAGEVTKP